MKYKFDTNAIHAGQKPDPVTGAVITPIYQTSTYEQESPGDYGSYNYSRMTNPTRTAFEDCLSVLEQGKYGLAFSSGMAAIDAVMRTLNPGDEVVSSTDLYGGSRKLFEELYKRYGIVFHYVNFAHPEELKSAINEKTKWIWLESPTNPLLKISDIGALAKIAHEKGIKVGVDNTFASPYLQNPLLLDADVVMHSVTKYIAGHSDVIMGALVVKDEGLYEDLKFYRNASGGIPGPQDVFLALRGVKTLSLRMKAHCENAKKVAEFLKNHTRVEKVFWPGLESHENHEIAKRQMRDFGGMVSLLIKDADKQAVSDRIKKMKIFTLAESLGGIESLVNHSTSMTHVGLSAEEKVEAGITDNLIRLSVGIEDIEDLLEDLSRLLD